MNLDIGFFINFQLFKAPDCIPFIINGSGRYMSEVHQAGTLAMEMAVLNFTSHKDKVDPYLVIRCLLLVLEHLDIDLPKYCTVMDAKVSYDQGEVYSNMIYEIQLNK